MKVRKLDLTEYYPGDKNPDGELVPYKMRDVLPRMMLAPVHQHDAMALLKHCKVVDLIEEFDGDHLLLDGADYDLLKACVLRIKGFTGNDREMITRVLEAELVDVKETNGKEITRIGKPKKNKMKRP